MERYFSKAESGFTLLEIMVALAVLALALVSLTRVTGDQARNIESLREASYVQWVAANAIAEIQLESSFPRPGVRAGEELMGLHLFYWDAEVINTENADVRRIVVRVFEGAARDNLLFQTAGFAGR